VDTLKVKFVGGPRDKKSRTLPGVKFPLTIHVPEDCKFHNVKGYYSKRGVSLGNTATYDWVPQ
jgi:hypothetical protein